MSDKDLQSELGKVEHIVEEIKETLHIDKPKYTNLILQGGGTLGVAYSGAIKALHEKGLLKHIVNFAGSSVGSIVAGALACGATFNFLEQELSKLNFEDLLDCSSSKIKNAYDLYYYYGICEGQKLIDWFGSILEQLTGNSEITLAEVHQKYGGRLVITTTAIGGYPKATLDKTKSRRTVYMDYITHPDMKLKIAVRMSSSYPIIFKPYLYENEYYVDGGLIDNYPIGVFHKNTHNTTIVNEHTLGLMFTKSGGITVEYPEIVDLKLYIESLLESMINPPQKQQMEPSDWERSIKIDVGNMSSTNFKLTDSDKKLLISRGYDAVYTFDKL
jgi:NTE family protein